MDDSTAGRATPNSQNDAHQGLQNEEQFADDQRAQVAAVNTVLSTGPDQALNAQEKKEEDRGIGDNAV